MLVKGATEVFLCEHVATFRRLIRSYLHDPTKMLSFLEKSITQKNTQSNQNLQMSLAILGII